MSKLTMGELFAGQCGFSVAGELSGIETKWMSEIEIAPIMVEKARFPEAKQLGDVSKVSGADIEPVDIITFGSPCFTKDTLIKTTEGIIPMGEITGGAVEYQGKEYDIKAVWINGVREIVRLSFEDGYIVRCTPDHKFLCADGWFEAKDMLGKEVLKDDGTTVKLKGIAELGEEEEVLDMEVDEIHLFPLGNGVIAHNCQDLSVAGKRKGMKHSIKGDEDATRSGLFFDAIRIIEEMRETAKKPRFAVWENVCFRGDVLVTTKRGLIPIKDVVVGDIVKTHNGEWHEVKETFKHSNKDVIEVSFQGNVEPITVTPNHPFYVRRHERSGSSIDCFADPIWKPIGEMDENDFIGFKLDGFGNKSIGMAEAYAVGRWLADGSYAERPRNTGARGGQKYRFFISTGYKKYEDLKRELLRLPYVIGENRMDHAINLTFTSNEFFELIKDCNKGARNKRMPNWVFDLVEDEQKELLRGYLDGDGHCRRDGEWSYSSSSRELAYGIARLVRNIYKTCVTVAHKKAKGTVEIEGRTVNANEFWVCTFKERTNVSQYINSSIYMDGYVWCRFKEKTEAGKSDVYNLAVEDVNSYEVNGISVHNCGALSSAKGEDFRRVLEELCQVKDIDAEVPKMDKWPLNGEIIGKDYSIAYRVFDAQYWGVPQRRRRIYLLADFDGHSAGKVVFRKDTEDFHAKINAWQEFGKNSTPMTGPEFIREFKRQQYEITPRETNEPSGKFARLDMSVGEWTSDVPEGYFIGEKPYYQNPTKLSEILIPNADPKYYLSPKACQGILRRAQERGKKLPDVLRIALENQAQEK